MQGGVRNIRVRRWEQESRKDTHLSSSCQTHDNWERQPGTGSLARWSRCCHCYPSRIFIPCSDCILFLPSPLPPPHYPPFLSPHAMSYLTPKVTRPGPRAFGCSPSMLSFSVGSDLWVQEDGWTQQVRKGADKGEKRETWGTPPQKRP